MECGLISGGLINVRYFLLPKRWAYKWGAYNRGVITGILRYACDRAKTCRIQIYNLLMRTRFIYCVRFSCAFANLFDSPAQCFAIDKWGCVEQRGVQSFLSHFQNARCHQLKTCVKEENFEKFNINYRLCKTRRVVV